MIQDITPIAAIDWESPGKRIYHIPFTYDGAWARVRIPLCVICGNSPGKTVAAIGGTHGDEYEGPVALKRLISDLEAESVTDGRLIIIPVLNVPAFEIDSRDSRLDGGNMNRAFPGDANGSITKRIARFVTDEVLTRADIVIDFHSAGGAMEIAPCTSFHSIDDPDLFEQYKKTAFLFGMPFTLIYTSGMGTGLLTEEAEKMGKITLGGEFGFGASTNLSGVRWAYEGLLNVMRYNGMMKGELTSLLTPEYEKQRLVTNTDINSYITAPISGISEPLVPLGSFVRAGQPVIQIHDFERFDENGCVIRADKDGYVIMRRFRARTNQGDVVMVIGSEIE
ncbi:M14 family metallopeptidase [Paenibacillus silvisoli]|uniref:succinylglutamate desuccinylase/aspartoacylase domain-containing protein n=1 Tax=Paenibacillus silvisoli TaxID=3110539 RepID=UPI002805D9D3|nr:succinylglutamate desuccinylase/aspartoacylase family protein [Paenibacillus silvisoli]